MFIYRELLKLGNTKQFFYATGCDGFARRSLRNTSVSHEIYLLANFHLPLTLWNASSGKSVSRMPRNSRLQLAEKSDVNGSSHRYT